MGGASETILPEDGSLPTSIDPAASRKTSTASRKMSTRKEDSYSSLGGFNSSVNNNINTFAYHRNSINTTSNITGANISKVDPGTTPPFKPLSRPTSASVSAPAAKQNSMPNFDTNNVIQYGTLPNPFQDSASRINSFKGIKKTSSADSEEFGNLDN